MSLQVIFDLEQKKAKLKFELAALDEQLKEEQAKIAPTVVFPEGKKTGYLTDNNLRLKMEKKETIKWDQAILNQARQTLGDEMFLPYFKYEWKHADKKAIDILIKTPMGKCILDAMTISTSTSFSLEQLEA